MRFLIDTNILLHAANSRSPDHQAAHSFLMEHQRHRTSWCTTWPILFEFLRVSTHVRVFPRPLKAIQALEFIENMTSKPEVTILRSTDRHLETLKEVVQGLSHPSGNLFHDIHTATLMREHGVHEVISADRHFLQFPFLKVTNPLST